MNKFFDKLIQYMTMLTLLWLIVICGVYIVKMCNGEISTLLGFTATGCVTTAVATVIALIR